MTLEIIKRQAQNIIDISYKTNDKLLILSIAQELKLKVNEERKKYV